MWNFVGSSDGPSSDQSSGVETGACGRTRTEYGGTTVWANALRAASR